MKDGGEVALDWLETNCDEDSPIIIILPGLTGESQAEYCKCLVYSANKIKIRCCVFNNRGLGGIALKTPRLYCAANCEDLSEVIHHVRKSNPIVKIGATGISMGGLILGELNLPYCAFLSLIGFFFWLINEAKTRKSIYPNRTRDYQSF